MCEVETPCLKNWSRGTVAGQISAPVEAWAQRWSFTCINLCCNVFSLHFRISLADNVVQLYFLSLKCFSDHVVFALRCWHSLGSSCSLKSLLPHFFILRPLSPPSSVSYSHRKFCGVSNLGGICNRLNSFPIWGIGEIVTHHHLDMKDLGDELELDPELYRWGSNNLLKRSPGLLVLDCLNPRPSCFLLY